VNVLVALLSVLIAAMAVFRFRFLLYVIKRSRVLYVIKRSRVDAAELSANARVVRGLEIVLNAVAVCVLALFCVAGFLFLIVGHVPVVLRIFLVLALVAFAVLGVVRVALGRGET